MCCHLLIKQTTVTVEFILEKCTCQSGNVNFSPFVFLRHLLAKCVLWTAMRFIYKKNAIYLLIGSKQELYSGSAFIYDKQLDRRCAESQSNPCSTVGIMHHGRLLLMEPQSEQAGRLNKLTSWRECVRAWLFLQKALKIPLISSVSRSEASGLVSAQRLASGVLLLLHKLEIIYIYAIYNIAASYQHRLQLRKLLWTPLTESF